MPSVNPSSEVCARVRVCLFVGTRVSMYMSKAHMLVISSNIFLVLSLHAVFRPYVNRLHIFKHLKLCLMSCKHPRNVGVLARRTRRQDAAAGRRAVSRPDSPAEVQLSHGSDGQVHTDEVAVRLVFVGAGDRVSGLEPKTEKKNHIYSVSADIFKEAAEKCKQNRRNSRRFMLARRSARRWLTFKCLCLVT